MPDHPVGPPSRRERNLAGLARAREAMRDALERAADPDPEPEPPAVVEPF